MRGDGMPDGDTPDDDAARMSVSKNGNTLRGVSAVGAASARADAE